jgi:uncharacterized SAM-binding protein YcdF (DUF218 family)
MSMVLKLALMGVAGGLMWMSQRKSEAAVVVLGISNKSQATERVTAAHYIASKYHASRVIVSGKGAGIDGLTEAAWMANQLVQLGYSPEQDPTSTSTKENVQHVAAMLPQYKGKVYVVSNHWHVQSAAWCLRHVYGLDAYWVQYPNNMQPVKPAKYPSDCNRAGCCA